MSIIKRNYYGLLQYGTEFLGLDLKYFASGGFWTTLGQGINTVLSLILLIAFANLLPKETYGFYRYILSLAGIFNIFTLMGMNTAVGQAVAAGNEGALKTSVKYQLKWNLIMAVAFWTLGGYYFINDNKILAISFLIFGIFIPLTSAFNTYGAYLEGKKKFKINNLFGIFSTALYVTGMILIMFLSKEVLPLIIAYSLTAFAATAFFYFKTIQLFNPPETPSRETIEYGKKMSYLRFISPIVAQIDKIVLTNYWGVEQLAVYALASAIPEKIGPYIKDMIGLGMPKLAQKTVKDINIVFWKRIFQTLGLGIVLSLGYILLSPIVFKYLLPQYLDSIFYSQILAITFVFITPVGYLGAAFTSQKMVRPIIISGLSMSITRIILYVILGIWGGILGLVLAQVIYYIIVFFVNIALWKFNKSYDKITT
ncbi:MAG: oligosaccharide flippase family protein [Candidatus Azambacteria bacterium]|nr:oligosaccharide flippase family protein [Candidatus Azambacteria bacterium]